MFEEEKKEKKQYFSRYPEILSRYYYVDIKWFYRLINIKFRNKNSSSSKKSVFSCTRLDRWVKGQRSGLFPVDTLHWTVSCLCHSFLSGDPGRPAYGTDGRDGERGPRGVPGIHGVPGPPGPAGLNGYCESSQCVLPMVASPVSSKDTSMKGPSEMWGRAEAELEENWETRGEWKILGFCNLVCIFSWL